MRRRGRGVQGRGGCFDGRRGLVRTVRARAFMTSRSREPASSRLASATCSVHMASMCVVRRASFGSITSFFALSTASAHGSPLLCAASWKAASRISAYSPCSRSRQHASASCWSCAERAAPKEGEKLLEEELLFWLNARDLRYTEPSLAFFLHTVGFDGKGKESRPLSVARFTSAFEAAKVHIVEI